MSSVTDAAIKKAIKEGHEQEKMFVVKAPSQDPQEVSGPSSPTNAEKTGAKSEENSLRDEEEGDGEGDVFPKMEMDEGVT